MPNWLRIILIIMLIGFCGLVAIGFVSYRWFKKHGNEVMTGMNEQAADARKFAAGKKTTDCVAEALRRVPADATFVKQMHARAWITECLRVAEEAPELCKGVPTGLVDRVNWPPQECTRRQQNNQTCVSVMQTVAEHCARSTAR